MASTAARPPILVLGVGNLLLRDDSVGLRVLSALQARFAARTDVEFLDGGTRGLMLLGALDERSHLLLLDAAALGGPPGKVHVRTDAYAVPAPAAGSAHEGNSTGLLQAARWIDAAPPSAALVGIEPAEVQTGLGLSPAVEAQVPAAVQRAAELLEGWLDALPSEARRGPSAPHAEARQTA